MSLAVRVDSSAQVAACDCLGHMGLVAAFLDRDHNLAVGVEDRGHLGHREDHDQEESGPCPRDSVGKDSGLEMGVSDRPEGQQALGVILISFVLSPFGVVATQEIGVGSRCWGLSVLHESGSH